MRDRREALRALGALAATARDLDEAPVFRALLRREQAGSTGVGNGFAIPHARIVGIDQPVTVYARTRAPIDFAAADGRPVTDLYGILVPAAGADEAHLQLLSCVAAAFSTRRFRAALAAASCRRDVEVAFARRIRADGSPRGFHRLRNAAA